MQFFLLHIQDILLPIIPYLPVLANTYLSMYARTFFFFFRDNFQVENSPIKVVQPVCKIRTKRRKKMNMMKEYKWMCVDCIFFILVKICTKTRCSICFLPFWWCIITFLDSICLTKHVMNDKWYADRKPATQFDANARLIYRWAWVQTQLRYWNFVLWIKLFIYSRLNLNIINFQWVVHVPIWNQRLFHHLSNGLAESLALIDLDSNSRLLAYRATISPRRQNLTHVWHTCVIILIFMSLTSIISMGI